MIEKITFCVSAGSASQMGLFTKVIHGIRKHGIRAHVTSNNDPKTKAVGCWGWRRGKILRDAGHDVLVFERGYLGDRFHWTSIAWNGLNGRADFCLPPEVKPDRFHQYFKLKPWKNDGKKIVIMGQVNGDMSLEGKNLTKFYEQTAAELKIKYGLPVFFRPHPAGVPRDRNFSPNIKIIYGDLQDVLNESRLVVTYNSNSGVDAVVNGIPALAFDAGSMAWPVTGHTVDDIVTPDRENWAASLAHCQWSPEEVETGAYWDRMKCKLEN